jgi:hypothetical protein
MNLFPSIVHSTLEASLQRPPIAQSLRMLTRDVAFINWDIEGGLDGSRQAGLDGS